MQVDRRLSVILFVLAGLCPSFVSSQQNIAFDEIPPGARFVSGPSPISLEADTEVTGNLDATGELQSATGVRFPDGTLQTSAAETRTGVTANSGMYANVIADFAPPNAYSEACFKTGALAFDIHAVGEPTAGGNCVPGDTGWVIERFERAGTQSWTAARAACLLDGMRLPEPFEWQLACDNEALFALDSMTDDYEWASNSAQPDTNEFVGTIAASVFGQGSCSRATRGTLGNSSGNQTLAVTRCVR